MIYSNYVLDKILSFYYHCFLITAIKSNRNQYFHNCIVLYCIMRPYTEGRLDRYRIGIPREMPEIRTQPWMSEGSLIWDSCHHRGPIF